MFGLALDADLDRSVRGSDTHEAAESKAKMVIDRWLSEPGVDNPQSFRDPFSKVVPDAEL
jgi:hypothetical protein